MKKLLIILFVCLLPFLGEAQTNHYVSTTGSDFAGDGTIANAWATLHNAASQVTTAGDTIQILDGTYTVTQAALIAPGVNVKGQSIAGTILKSHYKNDWNFNDPVDAPVTFSSNTEGTNGNQSISNLTLDGDALQGNTAIMVKCRSNVLIHDMTIKDFYINGISLFGSAVNSETQPTTYSTGNKIYNITIENCSDSDATNIGGGNININGQQGLEIYNFNLSNTARANGRNGDNILNNRYGKGLHIHDGISTKPSSNNDHWNFHFEIPNGSGGTEIDHVTFNGGDLDVDMGGNVPYDYSQPYMFYVHHNYLQDSLGTIYNGSHGKYSMTIEGAKVVNVIIDHNTYDYIDHVFSMTDGTASGTPSNDSNIVFSNNVANHTGSGISGTFEALIEIQKIEAGGSITGLKIINNTVKPNSTTNSSAINITTNNGATTSGVEIGSNIFLNGKNGYWLYVDNTGSTFDNFTVRNNNLFNNPNSNAINFTGNAVTNYTNTGNIFTDPLFVSSTDLHLQATSPNIGAGFDYGYGTDIGGLQSAAPPTISISADQSITVSNSSVSAVGTAASGETIIGYAWTVTSGTGTFGSPTSASTTVTALSSGANVLRCTVTQTDGQTAYKEVTITVNFPAPTANAGTDQTITLPASSANLSGSGTVASGQTPSYLWTKVSGSGTQIITGNTTLTPTVSGMTVAGDYVFQLKVTQTDNQFATSTVTIHVNPSQYPYVIFPVPIKVIQLR